MAVDIDREIKVNKLLGKRASLGPIPADQVLPWFTFGVFAYFVSVMLLGLSLVWWLGIWIWLAATWWALTGNATYKFVKSCVRPPRHDFINAETLFIPAHDRRTFARMRRDRLPYIEAKDDMGENHRFAPFQNFSQLHSLAEIELGGYKYAVLVLYDKEQDRWSAQIPFRLQGIHDQLERPQVEAISTALREGFRDLPEGEFLTFELSSRSDARARSRHLRAQAKQQGSDSPALAVFALNEEARTKEITEEGSRQVWSQVVWATWTAAGSTESESDPIGGVLQSLQNKYEKWLQKFAGTEQARFNVFYQMLARSLHETGFKRWYYFLNTRLELDVKPYEAEELWQHLWYLFNARSAPPLRHYIRVRETDEGLVEDVPVSGQNDLVTLLIQGDEGQSSVPRHKRQRGYVYARGMVGKAVVIEQPPEQWQGARDQLSWMWTKLSEPYVRDTQAVVQITRQSRGKTEWQLTKLAKQSNFSLADAQVRNTGKEVHASKEHEEARDALERLLDGDVPLLVAPVFFLWRKTEAEVDQAAQQFTNAFGASDAIQETDVCWRVYLEALPLNTFPLLTKYCLFSERRPTLDTRTVAGLLPLMRPRNLDDNGIEFVTNRGGHPVYANILDPAVGRMAITGTSGSGKSVLAFSFIALALLENVPVVGLDLSTGGNSTFATAVKLMGERAAYIDILSSSLNLLEPPDLRGLPSELQLTRMSRWKDMLRGAIVAISMGQINDQKLYERVDATVLRLLDVFFKDQTIANRYNEAFDDGWLSEAWQKMPTLYDLLTFCSPQKLGLDDVGDMDRAAINQLQSQVGAKLRDPNVGSAIGRPSTVAPDSVLTFYALSGLGNEQNAALMAMTAQMAAMRYALGSPRSLFVGDELSVLFGKRGFAEMIGELLATGRKDGISTLLLAQDFEAFANNPASAQMLANLTTTITGFTTFAATRTYTEKLNIPPEAIARNASDGYRANRAEGYTRWLIARDGRLWDTRYYSPPLMLAALANGEEERAARERVMQTHPRTLEGYLRGLRQFSDQYQLARRGSIRLADIGRRVESSPRTASRRRKAASRS